MAEFRDWTVFDGGIDYGQRFSPDVKIEMDVPELPVINDNNGLSIGGARNFYMHGGKMKADVFIHDKWADPMNDMAKAGMLGFSISGFVIGKDNGKVTNIKANAVSVDHQRSHSSRKT
jgi:hypothetical protein